MILTSDLNELLLSRHPRMIRTWMCGWRKSLVVWPAYGENEVDVPVVSAIPSRRVLEEPRAAKKRRNGGWKRVRREGAPEKEERILSRRGDYRVGIQRSVRPRPLLKRRPEDRSSRAIASSCLRGERLESKRNFFLFVELRDASSACAESSKISINHLASLDWL